MTVYIDTLRNWGGSATFQWKHSCPLYGDDLDELHGFAARIGMKRKWFQDRPRFPHYDLTSRRRRKALEVGAVEETTREMVRRLYQEPAAQTQRKGPMTSPSTGCPETERVWIAQRKALAGFAANWPVNKCEQREVDDCWPTCIEMITGLDRAVFPLPRDFGEGWEHEAAVEQVLFERGYAIYKAHRWIKSIGNGNVRVKPIAQPPFGWSIGTGPSLITGGSQHSVVCRDGEVWHDPHPKRPAVADIDHYEIILPLLGRGPLERM